jgi:hypothetical protein
MIILFDLRDEDAETILTELDSINALPRPITEKERSEAVARYLWLMASVECSKIRKRDEKAKRDIAKRLL